MCMKYILGLALSGFLLCAVSAQAQTFEQGTGILLPKKKEAKKDEPVRKPNITILNNNDGPKVLDKGKLAQPGGGSAIVVNPKQNDKGGGSGQRMTDAYAAHLYTGVCSQQYRETIAPKSEKNLNMQKLWNDVQTSCKCMSQQILSVTGASELADYVMYNYSGDPKNKPSLEKENYLKSGQTEKIQNLALNGELRKKCGFLK